MVVVHVAFALETGHNVPARGSSPLSVMRLLPYYMRVNVHIQSC